MKIEELSKDRSILIKLEVIRTLINFNGDFSKRILFELSEDKNNMVRVEVIDALKFFPEHDVFDLLKATTRDSYYLIRSYAIYSMTIVGINLKYEKNKLIKEIKNLLQLEKNMFCKLSCYEAIYILGLKENLIYIFKLFNSKNYRIRCAIINCLFELLSNDNWSEIEKFVDDNIEKEIAFAVKSNMRNLKERIDFDFKNQLKDNESRFGTIRF